MDLIALPAESLTVAMFLQAQHDAGLAVSTLQQRLAGIKAIHQAQQLPSPTDASVVREAMKGIRRLNRARVPDAKEAATDSVIREMLAHIDTSTLLGKRDRALLLYGYGGALRRSELMGIDVEHIKTTEQGHLLTIPFAKSDQEGAGQTVAILSRLASPLCPIQAMKQWLRASKIKEGPVFRRFFRGDRMGDARLNPKAVERLVKELAYRLRLDADRFAAHSLRSGFITSAVAAGARWDKVMTHARHRKFDTTLDYIDDREKFVDHPGEGLLDAGSDTQ
jgi:integrase